MTVARVAGIRGHFIFFLLAHAKQVNTELMELFVVRNHVPFQERFGYCLMGWTRLAIVVDMMLQYPDKPSRTMLGDCLNDSESSATNDSCKPICLTSGLAHFIAAYTMHVIRPCQAKYY